MDNQVVIIKMISSFQVTKQIESTKNDHTKYLILYVDVQLKTAHYEKIKMLTFMFQI